MVCCLNPDCQNPENPDRTNFCQRCGTKLVPMLRNRYRVTQLLSAEGGFGRTYLAEDTDKLNGLCVVKQLAPQQQGTGALNKAVQLFQEEARQLQHLGENTQIPALYAYFEEEGRLYIVQQFIEGQNLLQELEQQGLFSEQKILELLEDLLPILKFIHAEPVIHRDIKPQNIMRRRRDGRLVLIDFGVSKQLSATVMAKTGTRLGSFGYAALEQMEAGLAYPATDLYGLGATCFHLLTGIHPWELWTRQGYSWVKDWRQHLPHPVSQKLGQIIDKLLAIDIQERYQSVEAVSQDLAEQTLTVSKIGRGDYTTISEAIQNAPVGTRILVQPGIYHEGIIIDKPLEIIGDGATADIVIESTELACILMKTDYAIVRGLTLRCRAALKGNKYNAVDIPQGQLILEDCDITSDSQQCIRIQGVTANPTIRRCKIHDGKSAGVLIVRNGQGIVEDCDIFSNTGAGVAIVQGSNPTIRRCRIYDGNNCGVFVWENGQGIVENCDIFGNAYSGVVIKKRSNPAIRQCKIHDGKEGGVVVLDNGQGTVEDCDIFGNTGVGVQISKEGNPTIRRCQIHDGNNCGVLVDENCQGTVEDCDIFGNALAGVLIKQGGNPIIRRCQIHDGKQSGVWVYENGQGTVENCDIFGNALAGVTIQQGGNPTIRQCKIHDGKSAGVVVLENGQGTVEDCDIFGNALAGVTIKQGGNPTIRQCKIHDGKSAGVVVNENGQGTVEDCDIFGNALSGVQITQGGNPTIRRCKINHNEYEAVRVRYNGGGTVENCDLTGNSRGAWFIDWFLRVQRSGNKE